MNDKEILDYFFGPKCKDYEKDCATCQVWRIYEKQEKDIQSIKDALYDVDVDKEPTIAEEAWANQFDSKAEAFWYGEAQAIKNIKEAIEKHEL